MSGETGVAGGTPIVAFVAPVRGAGRTTTLANLAAVLVALDRRVLVVDAGTEGSHVGDYFSAFQSEVLSEAATLGADAGRLLSAFFAPDAEAADTVLAGGPARYAELRRYELPVGAGYVDVVAPSDLGRPPQLANRPWTSGLLGELRSALRSSDADEVLVDTPSDDPEAVVVPLAMFADTAVLCLAPQPRTFESSARWARRLQAAAPTAIRVVPVLSRVDVEGPNGARNLRDGVRRALTGERVAEDLDVEAIEFPYYSYAMYEALALFLEGEGVDRGVVAGCLRLVTLLTALEKPVLPPGLPAARCRYRRLLRLDPPEPVDEVVALVYLAADRIWADWIRAELERAGVTVWMVRGDARTPSPHRADGTPTSVVLVGAPEWTGSGAERASARITELLGGSDPVERCDVLCVRIAGRGGLPRLPVPVTKELDFASSGPDASRAKLLTHYGLLTQTSLAPLPEPRFPRRPTEPLLDLPLADPSFTGRSDMFERLRDHVTGPQAGHPVVLHGAPGVGKSSLALAYAYRYSADYDVVWWVPSHARWAVRASLAALANRLNVVAAGDAPLAAVRDLASGRHRWLLVYDDVDIESFPADLLPASGGTTILTSRTTVLPDAVHLEVGSLAPDESRALLSQRLAYLSSSDADRVASLLDHAPLALQLTAAWLNQAAAGALESAGGADGGDSDVTRRLVDELVDQLEREPEPPAEDTEPEVASSGRPPHRGTARALRLVTETLRTEVHGRLAVTLAEMLSFLAPSTDYRILASRRVLMQLCTAADEADSADGADDHPTGDVLRDDGRELDRVLWRGHQYGLFGVQWTCYPTVTIHRAVQDLLRAAMPPETRRRRQEQVLRGLAGYAPTDAEEDVPERKSAFALLQPHLIPSGALESDEYEVRRWVVNQVRHLYRIDDPDMIRALIPAVRQTLARWTATFGADEVLRLRLATRLASLYHKFGPGKLDDMLTDRLTRMARTAGWNHPRTLIIRHGMAADLRGAGRFDDAYVQDGVGWYGLVRAYGEDHVDSLRASDNLAISLYFQGNVTAALKRAQDALARRQRLYGPDHPSAWYVACGVGTYLRELGRYDEAKRLLTDALSKANQTVPPSHPHRLRLVRSLAVTKRRQGGRFNVASAQTEDTEALGHYRDLFGDDNFLTQSCRLSLAASTHLLGEHARAADMAREALAFFITWGGDDHPFTQMCRADLGILLLASGALDEAVEIGELAYRGLASLGPGHPWALAAALDHASSLMAAGDLTEALRIDRDVLRSAQDFLTHDHPVARAAEHNRAVAPQQTDPSGHLQWTRRASLDLDIPET